jgi:hypothetical protein
MTCGETCRLRRRRKGEKGRRQRDLPAVRNLERERQERHREREPGAVRAPPSRAGLTAEATEAIEEIVEKLRQEQRLSRDGLRRQLRRLALEEPASAEARD